MTVWRAPTTGGSGAHNPKIPEQGGARKTSSMVTKTWLKNTRAAWATLANQALQQAGQAARIDHRTLAEQGIDRIPGGTPGAQGLGICGKKGDTD